MSLHALATDMASKGRNGDSMLVHMTPGEVAGLHALALKHGGSLTINPDTGLPEASFLKSLLPMLAGFALGPAGFGLVSSAMGASAIVGGITGLATGSLSKGLMAGLGAYGGFGIGEALTGAGADAMTRGALSVEGALPSVENIAQVTGEGYGGSAANYSDQVNSAVKAARDTSAAMPKADLLSAGAKSAMTDPLGFAKQNMIPLGMAAAPIMADMMVPTTTKAPSPTDTGYIRQKIWDGRQFVDVGPVKASDWGSRNFSDVFTGRNYNAKDGGIVALAGGGVPGYAAGGVSDADILGWFNANPGAKDDVIAQTMQQAGVTPDQVARATGTDYADVNARYLAATAPATGLATLPNQMADVSGGSNSGVNASTGTGYQSVNDLYQNVLGRGVESEGAAGYWQNLFGPTIDANEVAQFQTAAQAELDARNSTANANSGLAALNTGITGATTPAYTNQYTYANINDYIANNNLDAAGIAAAAKQFNVDPAQITAAQNAQSVVSNVFRNVLGRDPDPNGLDYWTNQIMTGKSTGQEMLDTFIKNAQANKEIIVNPNIKLDDAVKDFGGYKSSNARDIADEWVRNTLGREVTEADRKQQWYKDAVNDAVMNTYGKAQDIYGGFKTYAQGEATVATAKAINDATIALAARGLSEADVVKQTGKTIAQLVAGGTNLGLDLYQASQLKAPGAATKFDFSTIQKAKVVPPVVPSVVPPTGVIPGGNYGRADGSTPGDITRNPDGTVTVTPNIPYRPYGGFSGMDEVKGAYTRGGGSLGYTSPTFNTIEEFNAKYLDRMGGDSRAAYDYLTGKGGAKYPTKSGVGQISKPYDEEVMGYPARTNVPYTYDKTSGKMVANPDYVAPSRDAKGNVTYGMSTNDIKKYLGEKPLAGQELYDWAQSNGISAQQVADATGRKLSDVYADFRAAARKAASDKIGTGVGASGTYDGGAGGDSGGPGGGGGGGSGPGGVGGAGGPASTSASNSADMGDTSGNDAVGGYYSRGKLHYRAKDMAMGGMAGYAVGGGLGSLGSYSDGGRLLKGPGDGVSDSIPATIGRKQQPARLADGEFVVPARIVSELGNGSTDAGAKKLYAMMDRVQRARGKTTGKNKVAANSRADKYLPA